ncbi:hypothetical protein J6590_056135 [Homalodisca vitripennis]|nr:hypothetical protein J6590_056135 [Homalodisca vitripennis]
MNWIKSKAVGNVEISTWMIKAESLASGLFPQDWKLSNARHLPELATQKAQQLRPSRSVPSISKTLEKVEVPRNLTLQASIINMFADSDFH